MFLAFLTMVPAIALFSSTDLQVVWVARTPTAIPNSIEREIVAFDYAPGRQVIVVGLE